MYVVATFRHSSRGRILAVHARENGERPDTSTGREEILDPFDDAIDVGGVDAAM
jgi:hypothetical protein